MMCPVHSCTRSVYDPSLTYLEPGCYILSSPLPRTSDLRRNTFYRIIAQILRNVRVLLLPGLVLGLARPDWNNGNVVIFMR